MWASVWKSQCIYKNIWLLAPNVMLVDINKNNLKILKMF